MHYGLWLPLVRGLRVSHGLAFDRTDCFSFLAIESCLVSLVSLVSRMPPTPISSLRPDHTPDTDGHSERHERTPPRDSGSFQNGRHFRIRWPPWSHSKVFLCLQKQITLRFRSPFAVCTFPSSSVRPFVRSSVSASACPPLATLALCLSFLFVFKEATDATTA